MKKIISTFLICFILFGSINFSLAASSCKYSSKIEECYNSDNKNAIEDFVCIEGNKEQITYNIILDEKFKKVDKEADEYLDKLQKAKGQFFGPDQKETFLTGIDQIEASFGIGGYFYNKYKEQIPSIIAETVACEGKTENTIVKGYFLSSNILEDLIIKKLNARKQVAYDIMKLNKIQVRKDSKKKYVQKARTYFSSVSNLFMINLGYLLRILHKWASKTRNPL